MRLFHALFPVFPERKRLYLDMDGVLLVTLDGAVAPARHAEEFLDFALANFDVYWLMTFSQGNAQTVLNRLDPQTPVTLRRKLARIRPARFHIEKTEALIGDFYWLGAHPLHLECSYLLQANQLDRWIELNTYARPDDLAWAQVHLRSLLERGARPGAGNPGIRGTRKHPEHKRGCGSAAARTPGWPDPTIP